MKTITLFFGFCLMAMTAFSQNLTTEKITVQGNCGLCENRIEQAAKSVEGVKTADWDKETKEMLVSYDSDKTDIDKVQTAIANSGHDTGKKKADDKVYSSLPGCCKYRK